MLLKIFDQLITIVANPGEGSPVTYEQDSTIRTASHELTSILATCYEVAWIFIIAFAASKPEARAVPIYLSLGYILDIPVM
jgi:hypothetical protein